MFTCHQVTFVDEYVEDGMVKIMHVKFENDESYTLTKNLSEKHHTKNSRKLITEKN